MLREALNVMSQVPPAGQHGGSGSVKQIPLLLMRTVMVSVATFPELKNFVATVVLVRLIQQQVRLVCDVSSRNCGYRCEKSACADLLW